MADAPHWWPYLLAESILTIDPRRAGQPCIAGTRVTAEAVAWSVWDQGVEGAAEDYRVTREQALVACWWLVGQIIHVTPSRRRRAEHRMAEAWLPWWQTASLHLASDSRGSCPDPPEVTDG